MFVWKRCYSYFFLLYMFTLIVYDKHTIICALMLCFIAVRIGLIVALIVNNLLVFLPYILHFFSCYFVLLYFRNKHEKDYITFEKKMHFLLIYYINNFFFTFDILEEIYEIFYLHHLYRLYLH